MKKIIIFIPYYGKFKNYFQFFLESIRFNPTIDFLIMTDDHSRYDYPPNVKIIYNTFKDFRNIVQNHFNFNISLETPYKLCDFKPAYGFIMESYFKGYDFWGFCDTDMIFGNIRHFITDDILSTYSRIFQKGHLSLFKNTKEWNTLFMNCNSINKNYHFADYREVFSSPQIFYFDEYNPNLRNGTADMWKILFPNKIYLSEPMDDVTWPTGSYYCFRSNMNDKNHFLVFSFNSGTLNRHFLENRSVITKESLYLHLHLWTMQTLTPPNPQFLIVPEKIINYQPINAQTIKKYTKKKYLKIYLHKFKYKIMNLFSYGK